MDNNILEQYEDTIRLTKNGQKMENRYSPYCDFIYYESTREEGLMLAMRVLKPANPSYVLASTHGWHMSVPQFEYMEKPQSEYLTVEVDMRGRAFSDGKQDCNGWELYDIIDAIEVAKKLYADYIIDPDVVYFSAGSGGGGNAFAISGKFPDYFTAITALSGISDYGLWYKNDSIGEFVDEMDVWIGKNPTEEMFASRSGVTTIPNLLANISIVHGAKDERVPVEQARLFVETAKKWNKGDLVRYLEFPEVGGRGHWQNMTEEQYRFFEAFCEEDRVNHRTPVVLPRSGKLVIAGYLFTKAFSVVMHDINRVASVTYDLDAKTFEVDAREDEYDLCVYE